MCYLYDKNYIAVHNRKIFPNLLSYKILDFIISYLLLNKGGADEKIL